MTDPRPPLTKRDIPILVACYAVVWVPIFLALWAWSES